MYRILFVGRLSNRSLHSASVKRKSIFVFFVFLKKKKYQKIVGIPIFFPLFFYKKKTPCPRLRRGSILNLVCTCIHVLYTTCMYMYILHVFTPFKMYMYYPTGSYT